MAFQNEEMTQQAQEDRKTLNISGMTSGTFDYSKWQKEVMS